MNEKKLTSAIQFELTKKDPINKAIGVLSQVLAKMVHGLAAQCRSHKYTEKNWNPAAKDYDPVFKESTEVKTVEAKWDSFKKETDDLLGRIIEITREFKGDLPEPVTDFLEFLVDFARGCLGAVDELVAALGEVNHILRLVNAFICGSLNEAREMIAGTLDIVSLLLGLKDSADIARLTEGMENAIEKFRKEPDAVAKYFRKAVAELKARYTNDKGEYQIAYYLGEDVLAAVTWVVAIVDAVKLVRAMPELYGGLVEWVDGIGIKRKRIQLREGFGDVEVRVLRMSEDLASAFIRKFEQSIIKNDFETMAIFDEAGTELRVIIGKSANVNFVLKDILLARQKMLKAGKRIQDLIFTHNHPSGSPLSASDLETAILYDLKEIRAVGKVNGEDIVYSFKRKGESISNRIKDKGLKNINDQLDKQFPKLKTDTQKMYSLDYQTKKAELFAQTFKNEMEYILFK